MFKKTVVSAILGLVMVGCASTRMADERNPAFAGMSFDRVLVMVAIKDLELRRRAEARLVEQITKRGGEVVAGSDLFFAGHSITREEMQARCLDHGIDAVLLVNRSSAGSSAHQLPTTYQSYTTVNSYSGTATTTEYPIGGGTVYKPRASYTVRLEDAVTGETIWIATAKSGGGGFDSQATLVDSFAKTTAKELYEEGLIRTLR